jgi:hypothetical protein
MTDAGSIWENKRRNVRRTTWRKFGAFLVLWLPSWCSGAHNPASNRSMVRMSLIKGRRERDAVRQALHYTPHPAPTYYGLRKAVPYGTQATIDVPHVGCGACY